MLINQFKANTKKDDNTNWSVKIYKDPIEWLPLKSLSEQTPKTPFVLTGTKIQIVNTT